MLSIPCMTSVLSYVVSFRFGELVKVLPNHSNILYSNI
jgi:hypothetical protein